MRSGKSVLIVLLILTHSALGQQPDSITVCVPIHVGWNLVSNPVLTASDSIHQLFPLCGPPCVYNPWPPYLMCKLPNGIGVWLKCSSDTVSCIEGEEIARDSIQVVTGWNLIGSISYPVATSSITSLPAGIISSLFFHHYRRYVVAEAIRPGWGYWVKVNASGMLILSSNDRPK